MCNCVHKHNKTPHNTQAQGPGFYHLPPKHRGAGFLPEKAYSYHIKPPVLIQKPDKTEPILKRLGNFFLLSLPRCYFVSLQRQLPDKPEKATLQRKYWMPKQTKEWLDEITPEQENTQLLFHILGLPHTSDSQRLLSLISFSTLQLRNPVTWQKQIRKTSTNRSSTESDCGPTCLLPSPLPLPTLSLKLQIWVSALCCSLISLICIEPLKTFHSRNICMVNLDVS